jgi:PAS domain S-box-containing protein
LLKGYCTEEALGLDVSTFYTPEDRAAGLPQRLLKQAGDEGRVETAGYRVRKDGTLFWADVVITAIRDPSGGLLGFAQVTRDLTERRHADDKLRQSEERFRILVEQVEDYAIFMLDPGGFVSTWNSGAQRIKGYTFAEIVGQHFSCFYEPADIAAGKCELELELATRIGRFEDEGFRLRKDGTRFWANVVITALRSSTGELLGFAKVTRDLTARRAAEEERMLLIRAQEGVRLRDDFLAIASHELMTPLTALQLQLDALKLRVQDMDIRITKRIEGAARSSTRLARLVESLLDVTHLATGYFALNLESFDLNELVAQHIDAIRASAQRVGTELVLHADEPTKGRWDRLRIEQVLTNLLSNAIKYGAGRPVHVDVERAGEEAIITVRDAGPGIPEEDMGRIFGRYERAVPVRHYGGLGLGLFVTQQIVAAHGGSVSVRNEPTGGACFAVRLPFAQEAEAAFPRGALH